MTTARKQDGAYIELARSLPSEVGAISPFVDQLMLWIRKCGCVPEGETEVEIALREALANAIIHGNLENPRKHVEVTCRCEPEEVSIAVKDEGRGFDIDQLADPTAPENLGSDHGRGIYLMKALMDDVRFEEGGVVVRMRKSSSRAAAREAHRAARQVSASVALPSADMLLKHRSGTHKVSSTLRRQFLSGIRWGEAGIRGAGKKIRTHA